MKRIILITIMLIVAGCTSDVDMRDHHNQESAKVIPPGATVIKYLEYSKASRNPWIVFSLKGECFLFYEGYRRRALAPTKCENWIGGNERE